MKYYKVWAKHKKSVVESEMYKDEDGNLITHHTHWRNGEFKVGIPETAEEWAEFGYEPEDVEFVPKLEDFLDETCELEDFPEVEMESCWDGCYEEFEYKFKDGFEERQEIIESLLEEEGSSALWDDDHGFESFDGWYVIYDGIEFEEYTGEDN